MALKIQMEVLRKLRSDMCRKNTAFYIFCTCMFVVGIVIYHHYEKLVPHIKLALVDGEPDYYADVTMNTNNMSATLSTDLKRRRPKGSEQQNEVTNVRSSSDVKDLHEPYWNSKEAKNLNISSYKSPIIDTSTVQIMINKTNVDNSESKAIDERVNKIFVSKNEIINNTKILREGDTRPYVDAHLHIKAPIDGHKAGRHKLLWWNAPGWLIDLWNPYVDMSQCPYSNCGVTTDRKLFSKSSAVIFSISDRGLGTKPPVDKQHRNTDQAWVFYSLESPVSLVYKDYLSPHWNGAFNWSWSYRRDADIFHPYGILQTKDTVQEKNYTEIFRRKSKIGAWIVSHCNALSFREAFWQMLQRYINVEMYGKCSINHTPDNIKKVVEEKFKFYFALENSLCKDYVTEKFFNYFKMDIITVVRGSIDYNSFLPNGTFINTADFASTKELADFLIQLGNNETEYIKYLKRKDRYNVKERDFMYRNALCDLCAKVNNLETNRRTYGNIKAWLGYCFAPNDLH